MTKTILILAIVAAFVAGSIATGTLAFAGGDDDDDLSQLACEAGKVMTGILFEEDDINDILCATDNVNDADSSTTNEIQSLVIVQRETTTNVVVVPGSFSGDQATCLADEVVTGGGITINAGRLVPSHVILSAGQGGSWTVFLANDGTSNIEFRAIALCAKLTP